MSINNKKFSEKWLSSKEMLDMLKKRQLLFKDERFAIEYFNNYNYVDGKQYSELFIIKGTDDYAKGTYFENILNYIEFERFLSHVVLKPILEIEKHLGKKLCDVILPNTNNIYGHYNARKYFSKLSGRNIVEKLHADRIKIKKEGIHEKSREKYIVGGDLSINSELIKPDVLERILKDDCGEIGKEYASEEPHFMIKEIDFVKNKMEKKKCFKKFLVDGDTNIPFGYFVNYCGFYTLIRIFEFINTNNKRNNYNEDAKSKFLYNNKKNTINGLERIRGLRNKICHRDIFIINNLESQSQIKGSIKNYQGLENSFVMSGGEKNNNSTITIIPNLFNIITYILYYLKIHKLEKNFKVMINDLCDLLKKYESLIDFNLLKFPLDGDKKLKIIENACTTSILKNKELI